MQRQQKQTADKHHVLPGKLIKGTWLIDAKKSRFGAENLTKRGDFINLSYYMCLI